MANKTREIQQFWWDWLSTAERLLRSLYEQTVALTLRDLPRIEKLQPELDTLMVRLQKIDEQATTRAKKLAEELGAEPSLRGLVRVLDKAEAQQVQAIANRVTIVAQNIQEVLDKNKVLVENELTYVNGTLALIAKAASEQQTPMTKPTDTPVLMDQVA